MAVEYSQRIMHFDMLIEALRHQNGRAQEHRTSPEPGQQWTLNFDVANVLGVLGLCSGGSPSTSTPKIICEFGVSCTCSRAWIEGSVEPTSSRRPSIAAVLCDFGKKTEKRGADSNGTESTSVSAVARWAFMSLV